MSARRTYTSVKNTQLEVRNQAFLTLLLPSGNISTANTAVTGRDRLLMHFVQIVTTRYFSYFVARPTEFCGQSFSWKVTGFPFSEALAEQNGKRG